MRLLGRESAACEAAVGLGEGAVDEKAAIDDEDRAEEDNMYG